MFDFTGAGYTGITRPPQNRPCRRGTEKVPSISEDLTTANQQVTITVISNVLSDFTGYLHLPTCIQNNFYIINFKAYLDVRL